MKEFDKTRNNGLDMTEIELERELESPEHLILRNAVRELREDPVSMTWRSRLNEQLVARIEAKQRRRRFAWILSPALGLSLAGAVAVIMLAKTPTIGEQTRVSSGTQIEESLVAAYQDTMRYTDITGVGLNHEEVVSRRSPSTQYDFSEVDLGSL